MEPFFGFRRFEPVKLRGPAGYWERGTALYAVKTIRMTFFTDTTSDKLANALITAARNEVTVKLILNGDLCAAPGTSQMAASCGEPKIQKKHRGSPASCLGDNIQQHPDGNRQSTLVARSHGAFWWESCYSWCWLGCPFPSAGTSGTHVRRSRS